MHICAGLLQYVRMNVLVVQSQSNPDDDSLLNICPEHAMRNLYHQDRWGLVNRMAALHHVIYFILMVGLDLFLYISVASSIITNLPLPLCFCSVCVFDAHLCWISAVCSHERLAGAVTKQSLWWTLCWIFLLIDQCGIFITKIVEGLSIEWLACEVERLSMCLLRYCRWVTLLNQEFIAPHIASYVSGPAQI